MATKSPNADKANAKWAELQRAESTTISKIVNGTASTADIKKLQTLLSNYSKLAGDVFKRGNVLIEKAANQKAAAEVNRRTANGETLTEADHAKIVKAVTQAMYVERGGDLIKAVGELFSAAQEDTHEFIGDQFVRSDDESRKQYEDLLRRINARIGEAEKRIIEEPPTPKSVQSVLAPIVEQAEKGNTSLLDSVEDDTTTVDSGVRNSKEKPPSQENVRNWAYEWWRGFRTSMWQFMKNNKDTGLGFAELAGLTYLMSPDFRKWIDSKITEAKDWFDQTAMAKALKQAYDFIKEETSNFVHWIVKECGVSTPEMRTAKADLADANDAYSSAQTSMKGHTNSLADAYTRQAQAKPGTPERARADADVEKYRKLQQKDADQEVKTKAEVERLRTLVIQLGGNPDKKSFMGDLNANSKGHSRFDDAMINASVGGVPGLDPSATVAAGGSKPNASNSQAASPKMSTAAETPLPADGTGVRQPDGSMKGLIGGAPSSGTARPTYAPSTDPHLTLSNMTIVAH